jgi:ABC-type sugar transport system substrate-binding protein
MNIRKMAGAFVLACAALGVIYLAYYINSPSSISSKETVSAASSAGEIVNIGFSQLGAESDWRVSHTASIEAAFPLAEGYNLLFDNGRQKQENQIKAIRNFIQQQVDYIVLSPITEDGWDTVLEEAKDAGIPVIISDRMVKLTDESLYTAWIGSDMKLEGKKAAAFMHAYFQAKGVDENSIRAVDIQGTIGASPQIGRSSGIAEGCSLYGWTLLAQEGGEFVKAKAYEVMTSMLDRFEDINVVYCENDGEAAGAIEALEDRGITPGTDIQHGEVMVVSFDATASGLGYIKEGKIALDVECNPLQGPAIRKLIDRLESGGTVEKTNYIDEQIFAGDDTVKEITIDGKTYPVAVVTDQLIEERTY